MDDNLIASIVKKISTKFQPKKVYLFGSRAWGNPTVDSDLDLFVVMPSSLRRDNRSVEISKLFPDRLFSLDVLVYTPKEVEKSLQNNNPFIKEIISKGIVLYDES
ncbi:hypothetical protein A2291_04665 [candidate division WOR-1 bacterium RIFOXYB2_FULL_42_35]|uniref:Polymerase beta nucleotidyltransferase domain-containing protein n=1 Tax=candidate division WOR-1 bacterium RIFOXYC2_FULL_41_25 TaxID=1802586 RepID=A0A1F4TLD2_UNCSA|nr:MAG: hypothetical protein A2247_07290 [candidate division WOR-1 bacterium RIFOXYA2_FULL_41_14]OGC22189.1 MAG: hypothetical protein A2291_04665 [candidate division WOR-1 bacterium RIFOXYB2_FULL_42_35]OGC33522.1 MAG: hypothetical protein A2462_08905 [candidate division WOR-1 bacterium RIFOXYC2_FULL_41_25]OGC43207.1 MAG: hypothetical protein A2548_01885 [candidate division WOR-1 bacterium RIFOXYD2_FULL_41_8]